MHIISGQLPVRFQRKFHLGDYEASHAQVLFRSGRTGYHDGEYLKYDSVADILFKNVAALAVGESYYPLEVSLAGQADMREFNRFLKCEIGDRNLYVLRDGTSIGYVLAGAMYWIDDATGSIEHPSLLLNPSDRTADIDILRA